MASTSYVGSKVRIEADSDILEGIVSAVHVNSQRLTLENVVSLKTKKKHTGIVHFFRDDIKKLTVVQERVPEQRVVGQEEDTIAGRRLVSRKDKPAHLKNLKHVNPAKLVLQSGHCSENEIEKRKFVRNKPVEDEMILSSSNGRLRERSRPQNSTSDSNLRSLSRSKAIVRVKKTDEYTIIDAVDNDFTNALANIRNRDIVGLAAEGILIGRKGQLCWLQVSTDKHVFLFDIITLGEDGFDNGLRGLLQCPDIQKVMHDCRFLSDLLFHQYNIRLVNIFDTQVASVLVYKIFHGNDLPAYVESLSSAILNHLEDIDTDDIFYNKVRETCMQEDLSVWAERPVTQSVLDAALKNTKHLIKLRTVLMQKLLTDLVDGIDIYLSIVRDANNKQAADVRRIDSHRLPTEFRNIRSCAEERRQSWRRTYGDENEFYDRNGFRLNTPAVEDPHVKKSVDGVWYMKGGERYRNISPERPSARRGRAVEGAKSRSRSRSASARDRTTVLELAAQANGMEQMNKEQVVFTEGASFVPDVNRLLSSEFISCNGSEMVKRETERGCQLSDHDDTQPSQHSKTLEDKITTKSPRNTEKSPQTSFCFTPAGHECQNAILKKGESISPSRVQAVGHDKNNPALGFDSIPDSDLALSVRTCNDKGRYSRPIAPSSDEENSERQAAQRLKQLLMNKSPIDRGFYSSGSDTEKKGARVKNKGRQHSSVDSSPYSSGKSACNSETESGIDAMMPRDSMSDMEGIKPRGRGARLLSVLHQAASTSPVCNK